MPFVSKAQRGFLWANHPAVAREFAAATPKGAKLPRKVRKKGRGKRASAEPPSVGVVMAGLAAAIWRD